MKTYPSVVSRTLDPSGKSLATVVSIHDHEISDADINLIQDLQDLKRQRLLQNGPATSGCLTWKPMVFDTTVANTLTVPQFDALFNGEVVTVAGSLSADQTLNKVVLPAPAFWTEGSPDEQALIYVAFLEIWYQSLDPITGQGYYVDPVSGLHYFYPYGGVTPNSSFTDSLPDDSIDIFQPGGLYTTQRAQIQWRINVQRVSLNYDFAQFRYGLDSSGDGTNQAVYAQAGQASPIAGNTVFQFQNLGALTGDTGIWRAGDGNPENDLGTMDGYSYAMPLAIVFQRNSGPFSLGSNIFGCADPLNSNSGLLQYVPYDSGRFDFKLADQVFADDTVDTRQTVSLDGWDYKTLADEGFVDVLSGSLHSVIARGESPGMSGYALGSALEYYVSMSPTVVGNTNTVGNFDGFANGFSSDQRIFYVTRQVTVNMKSSPTNGQPWSQNDVFTISLPATSNAVIAFAFVQGFNTSAGTKTPINLLSGQVIVSGLSSKTVVVSFPYNLSGTPFDPGASNLYVTLGVSYPAGGAATLVKVPFDVDGGILYDAVTGSTLPVYGVSEYSIQAQQQAEQAYQVWTYNPEYSSVQFGTRIWVKVLGSTGVQQTVGGNTITTFVVQNAAINGSTNGLYVIGAWDLDTEVPWSISARTMIYPATSNPVNTCLVTIQDAVPPTSVVVMAFMAQNTVQAAFNAPVKGITEIEETVLFGTYVSTSVLHMDSRVIVESVSYDSPTNVSTVVLAAKDCTIKGISGDDVSKLVWVMDQLNNLNAVQVSAVELNNGYAIVTVPAVNLNLSQFMFVGSILPAFDPNSVLTIEERYIPYQGEGIGGRNYEMLYTADNALITTNGTGAAPTVGLSDVFPYNRELPISVTLPSQVGWSDSTLMNTPLSTLFDSNYVAMRQNNVETTFEVPLHTNDFILPMNKDIRKQIQLQQGGVGGRGFAQAVPHVGFAISAPSPRTVLGQNLQSTTAPIVLYVNNASGNDVNDGLTVATAKLTITAAVNTLPPVLRHPCSIQLVTTGVSYDIGTLSSTLQVIALGDGVIRSAKWYALANLAFSIQEEGRIVITSTASATNPIVIEATNWAGFGDGPTSAFFVNNSRVLFNNIQFQGFTNPAVYGIDSDIEFVNCVFSNNVQAGGFEQGCGIILTGGSIILPTSGSGFVLSQSVLTVSDMDLTVVAAAVPGAFFTGERGSSLNLFLHAPAVGQETNLSALTVVAYAQLNSNIVVASSFQSAGQAVLTANSVLSRSVTIDPFLGGIILDSSSSVVTQL